MPTAKKKRKPTKAQMEKRIAAIQVELNERLNSKNLVYGEIDKLWNELFDLMEKTNAKTSQIAHNRNQQWAANHTKIKQAIDHYVRDYNNIPSAYQLAGATGLSRQTVSKHLREFDQHELYGEEMKQYEFAANMLLERALAIGCRGNLKAIQFYVNTIDRRKQAAKLQKPDITNNLIQINNIYVNAETIKALSAEKLKEIEEIILSENLGVDSKKVFEVEKGESLQKLTEFSN